MPLNIIAANGSATIDLYFVGLDGQIAFDAEPIGRKAVVELIAIPLLFEVADLVGMALLKLVEKRLQSLGCFVGTRLCGIDMVRLGMVAGPSPVVSEKGQKSRRAQGSAARRCSGIQS